MEYINSLFRQIISSPVKPFPHIPRINNNYDIYHQCVINMTERAYVRLRDLGYRNYMLSFNDGDYKLSLCIPDKYHVKVTTGDVNIYVSPGDIRYIKNLKIDWEENLIESKFVYKK